MKSNANASDTILVPSPQHVRPCRYRPPARLGPRGSERSRSLNAAGLRRIASRGPESASAGIAGTHVTTDGPGPRDLFAAGGPATDRVAQPGSVLRGRGATHPPDFG